MSRVFQVIPKRIKRVNGTVLTPEMVVTVTTQTHTSSPFNNGAKEVQEAYMRLYNFDYKKAGCSVELKAFCFYVMGQGLEKKSEDLQEEVAKQVEAMKK